MTEAVVKQTKVQLVDGFEGPAGHTKEIVFRRAKAGDLKVMDGKGDHEGLQAFAALITNTTPSMIANLYIEDYALVVAEVRRFLEALNRKPTGT